MARVTGERRRPASRLFRKQKVDEINGNKMVYIENEAQEIHRTAQIAAAKRTTSNGLTAANKRRRNDANLEPSKMISNDAMNHRHNQHQRQNLNLNNSRPPHRPHVISILTMLFLISVTMSFCTHSVVQCRRILKIDLASGVGIEGINSRGLRTRRAPRDLPSEEHTLNSPNYLTSEVPKPGGAGSSNSSNNSNNTSSLLNFDILAKEFDDDSTSRSNLNTLLKVIDDTRGLKNKTRKHIHDLIVLKDQRVVGGANRTVDSAPAQQQHRQHRRIVYEDTIFLERAIREISGKMNMSYEGESRSDPAIHWMILYNDTTILVVRSANKYYYWTYAQTVGSLVIFCMIVVGNASILHRLKSSKRRRSNVNYFIVQLAIADLLVGIFSVTLDSLLRIQKAFVWGLFACRASKYISVLFIYSSTNLLVALSIDRWEAVVKPLAFTRNRSRGYHLVAASWLFAFVCAFPVIPYTKVDNIDGLPQCWIDLSNTGWRVYMIYLTCLLLVVPTLIIAICYTHIVYTIWKKARQVSQQQQQQQHRACKRKHGRRKSRSATRQLSHDLGAATSTSWLARDPESNSDIGSVCAQRLATAGSNQQQQQLGQIELEKSSLREDDEILLRGNSNSNFSLPKCHLVRETVTRLGQRFRRRCTVEIGSSLNQATPPPPPETAIFGKTSCDLVGVSSCSRADECAIVAPLAQQPPAPPPLATQSMGAKNTNISASRLSRNEVGGGIEMMMQSRAGARLPPSQEPRPRRRRRTSSSSSSMASSLIAPSQSSMCDSFVGPLEGGGGGGAVADATEMELDDNLRATTSRTTNDVAGGGPSSGELIVGDRRLTGAAPDVEQWPVVAVGGGDKRQVDDAVGRQRSDQRVALASALTPRGCRQSRRAMSEDLGGGGGGARAGDDAETAEMRTRTIATRGNLITITSEDDRAAARTVRTQMEAAAASRALTMQAAAATIAPSSSEVQIGPHGDRNKSNNNNNHHHRRLHVNHQTATDSASATSKHERPPGRRDLDFASQQHGSGVIPKARIKTIKMTLVIVAAYILCWSPFLIVNMCVVFKFIGNNTNVSHALLTLTQSLAHLNSAVNPIIFWIFSSKRSQTNANKTTTNPGGGGTGGGGGAGMGGGTTTHTSGLFQQIASNGACKTAIAPATGDHQSQLQNFNHHRHDRNRKTNNSNM